MRISGPLDLTLSALLLVNWAVLTLWRMRGMPALDLTALYMAGQFWAEGGNDLIYATASGFFGAAPPQWADKIAAIGLSDMSFTPYIYPPLWLPLLRHLADGLTIQPYFEVARIVLVPMLAASVPLAWRIARPGVPLLAAVLFALVFLEFSHIARFALSLGQPQIVVTFLILLAFCAYTYARPAIAGAVLAVAAAIKLLPALFVLIFVIDRNWRALAAFCIVGAALASTSLVIGGLTLHMAYLDALGEVNTSALLSVYNPSLKAVLAALQYPQEIAGNNVKLAPIAPWVIWGCRAAGLGALAFWIRAGLRLPEGKKLAPTLFALAVIAAAFGPLGWMHYYLLPALLLPCLLGALPRRRVIGIVVLFLLFTSTILVAGILVDMPYGPIIYDTFFLTGALALAFVVLSPSGQQSAKASPYSRENVAE